MRRHVHRRDLIDCMSMFVIGCLMLAAAILSNALFLKQTNAHLLLSTYSMPHPIAALVGMTYTRANGAMVGAILVLLATIALVVAMRSAAIRLEGWATIIFSALCTGALCVPVAIFVFLDEQLNLASIIGFTVMLVGSLPVIAWAAYDGLSTYRRSLPLPAIAE